MSWGSSSVSSRDRLKRASDGEREWVGRGKTPLRGAVSGPLGSRTRRGEGEAGTSFGAGSSRGPVRVRRMRAGSDCDMAGVANGAERDKPEGVGAELTCGTGTGADPATAAHRAGVDFVPLRCFASRPEGFCSTGSDSGDGVWRVRDWFRRLGDAGFSWVRRPRALGDSWSSSSDVGRERGFLVFSDLGVALGAGAEGVALRWRGGVR